MGTAVIGVRVLLAVVFATAGVGKLLDIQGSRQAIRDFGVSGAVADVAGVLLPLAELAAAIALLFQSTAQWGAVLAFLLLLVFIGGIANAMRQGVAPDCHCFGQLHSAPAGRGTLIRNGVLAAFAAFAIIEGPGPAISTWLNGASAAEVVAVVFGILLVGLASFAAQLYVDSRRLAEDLGTARRMAAGAPPGLPVGTVAPDFTLSGLDGSTTTLDQLRERERPVLLVFASPNCNSCLELFPNIRRWQHSLAERLTIAVISAGPAKDNAVLSETHGLDGVLLQDKDELIQSYRIRGTPTAILVNLDGTIGSLPAESVFGIEPMVRLILRDAGRPAAQPSLA